MSFKLEDISFIIKEVMMKKIILKKTLGNKFLKNVRYN